MRWIKSAERIGHFRLKIVFDDDFVAEIDFANLLNGPIFEPLRDSAFFDGFFINPDFQVLSWPNGADFATDFIYKIAKNNSKESA